MKKILIALSVALLLAVSCASPKTEAQSSTFVDILRVDISQTIINPDSLVVEWFELDENGRVIDQEEDTLKRPTVLGYVGGDFCRFRIHFTVVKKVGLDYQVRGVAGILNARYNFEGVINLDSVKVEEMSAEAKEAYGQVGIEEYGTIYASYRFVVGSRPYGGEGVGDTLRGTAWYGYMKMNGTYMYDCSDIYADGFCNNQYEGVWVTKDGKTQKVCNWGDFRIPNSDGLDIGAGVFSPEGGKGWENYVRIEDEPLLWECDRNWWQQYYEVDWDYELLLEQAYAKLTDGGSLTLEELKHLLPNSEGQFSQYYADAHIVEKEGVISSGRLEAIDSVMMKELDKGDTELIKMYLRQFEWSDGWVAEWVTDVAYHLWKKFPTLVEPELKRLGWFESMIEFEEQ